MTVNSKDMILVTGGACYFGAHACKAPKRAGYTPVTNHNLVYGHQSAAKRDHWMRVMFQIVGDCKH